MKKLFCLLALCSLALPSHGATWLSSQTNVAALARKMASADSVTNANATNIAYTAAQAAIATNRTAITNAAQAVIETSSRAYTNTSDLATTSITGSDTIRINVSGTEKALTYTQLKAQLEALYSLTAGVKIYRALITQESTDAPTANVLENSLGGTVVWTRSGAGDYRATLIGAFPVEAKVFTRIGNRGLGDAGINTTYWQSADQIQFRTLSNADGYRDDQMEFCEVEILVYP